MVYMHAYLNTLLLLHSVFMLSLMMALKGEGGGHALKSHGNYIVNHEKIMELCFEFPWEPCIISYG